MTDNHVDDPWEIISEERELILDEDPNVHLKNAELALCERRYDDAETHASYAENVSRGASEERKKQVLEQCNIVRGFVYLARAEAAIDAGDFARAENYVRLAGPLCKAEKRILEKYRQVGAQVNAHLLSNARQAFDRGSYGIAEKCLAKIADNDSRAGIRCHGHDFDILVGSLVSMYIKNAGAELSAGNLEGARLNINRGRSVAKKGGSTSVRKLDSALTSLVGEYLNGARAALARGRYEAVITYIDGARVFSEGCNGAERKCEDMIFALADDCLGKARSSVSELRFDDIWTYIGYAKSVANGRKKILQGCAAVQAYAYLEKAKLALGEKQYEAVQQNVRQAQEIKGSCGAESHKIESECTDLLKSLTLAYLEEANTALGKCLFTDAQKYAESARLLADQTQGVQQPCRDALTRVHIALAETAMEKKLYADAERDAKYVQSISNKSGGDYYRCGIIRSQALLAQAKDAFDRAFYEQAVLFLGEAKSASMDDAAIGKQCMKLLRRLKRKGFGKYFLWDVDRLRKEAFIRGLQKTAKIAAAIAAVVAIAAVTVEVTQHRRSPSQDSGELLSGSESISEYIEDDTQNDWLPEEETIPWEERSDWIESDEPEGWQLDPAVLYDILLYPYEGEEIDELIPVESESKALNANVLDCATCQILTGDTISFRVYLGDCYGLLSYYEKATRHGLEAGPYRMFSWQPALDEKCDPAQLIELLGLEFVCDVDEHVSLYDWDGKLSVAVGLDYDGINCFHPFILEFVLEDDLTGSPGTGYPELPAEEQAAPDEVESDGEPASFSELPELEGKVFVLFNGAQTWSLYVEIGSDGVFRESYFDRRPDETGADYPNGTVYVHMCNGVFTDLRRLSDDVYEMRANYPTSYVMTSESEVVDGTLYVYEDVDIVSHDDVFRLYLPGTKIEDLPEDFLSWVKFIWEPGPALYTLPRWGLHNVTRMEGFIG